MLYFKHPIDDKEKYGRGPYCPYCPNGLVLVLVFVYLRSWSYKRSVHKMAILEHISRIRQPLPQPVSFNTFSFKTPKSLLLTLHHFLLPVTHLPRTVQHPKPHPTPPPHSHHPTQQQSTSIPFCTLVQQQQCSREALPFAFRFFFVIQQRIMQ